MDKININEEALNIQIRKFLKRVGIQSQREIENAVKKNMENGGLDGIKKLDVSVLLELPEIGIKVPIKGEIELQKS